MIHNLKPYPAYKDSGIPWLGDVPEHWEVKRNKLFLREINERSEDGSEELLTVSQYTGVTARRERISEENGLLTNAASLVGYKRVKPGDLVMNIMLAWNGSLGVSPIAGIASPAYCVYRATEEIESRFFHYLFRTPLFTGVFKAVSTGVVDSRLRLYPEVFFRLISILPPKEEQSAIVRYLDHIDRRIRHYIRAKKKLIKLLEEQKQVIIHQAVTRGLDPNVKLKPSGIEWLGDVPEHWDIVALKHLCSLLRDGTHLPPARQSTGIPLLSVRNIVEDRFVNRDDDSFISFYDYEQLCRSFVVQQNDVLLAIVGATLGKVAIVPAMSPFHIQRSLAVFRPKHHKLLYDYLAFFLRGPAFQRALWATVAFSAQPGIYLNTLGAFRIAVPPLDEQKQIVLKVSQHTQQIQQAIDKTKCEISLLREYRTRLIADVVTGKLDVREAAANLPEETDETETLDDSLAEDEELESNQIENEQAGELEDEVLA